MKNITLFIFTLLTLLAINVSAEDAPVRVDTSISQKSLFLGEPVTFNILVSGSDSASRPNLSKIEDFSYKFEAEAVLKNKGKTGYSFTYRMVPRKSGVVTIPAIKVNVNGKVLQTKSLTFQVKKPQIHPGLILTRKLSKQQCYVGEPVIVTYTWYTELPIYGFRAMNIDLPLFYHKNFRMLSHNVPVKDDPLAIGLPVSSNRVIARRGKAQIDGKPYETIRFTRLIVPQKEGEFKVSPGTLLCSYIQQDNQNRRRNWRPQYPSYFNNDFFESTDSNGYKKYLIKSDESNLVVVPLPKIGRPVDFSGQIGKCLVSATATPRTLHVGDPVTLTVTVSGHTLPATIDLPPLHDQDQFNRRFSIPERQASGNTLKESKTFIRTIRPLSTEVKLIPAVRIAYFDPTTGKYGVAQSETMSLKVKPAASVTAFDADLSDGKVLKNKLIANADGIRHNVIAASAIRTALLQPIQWLLLLGLLPPALFLLLYFASRNHRFKRRNPQAYQARIAFGIFRSAMTKVTSAKQETIVTQLDNAIRGYFADKLQLGCDAHTFDELETVLNNQPADFTSELATLKQIYQANDLQRFTSKKVEEDIKPMISQVKTAISNVNKKLVSSPAKNGLKTGQKRNKAKSIILLFVTFSVLFCSVAEASETKLPNGEKDRSQETAVPWADDKNKILPNGVEESGIKDNEKLFDEANQLFEEGTEAALNDPDKAEKLYHQASLKYQFMIEERGINTASMLMNLANACHLSCDNGRAILHYHRAKLLNPGDGDIIHNLNYVRNLCTDTPPKAESFDLWQIITTWHRWPFALRATLFGIANTLVWLIAGLLLFRKSRSYKWGIGASALIMLIFGSSLLVTSLQLDRSVDGVITVKEVTARQGDGLIYDSAFNTPLHAGTEFSILETRDDWHHIKLTDDTPCWIPIKSATLVTD